MPWNMVEFFLGQPQALDATFQTHDLFYSETHFRILVLRYAKKILLKVKFFMDYMPTHVFSTTFYNVNMKIDIDNEVTENP